MKKEEERIESALLKRQIPLAKNNGISGYVCAICVDSIDATPGEVKGIYDEDPGVQAGVLTFEVHPCRSFPGDTLPE